MMRWLMAVCVLCVLTQSGCLSFHSGPIPGEPTGELWRQIEDTRVHYTDTGEGEAEAGRPVVLIHGFASSLYAWRGLAPVLEAQGRRVIALDLRGFGWTDRPEGADYSPAAQARLVRALVRGLGVERYDVVAHSWGSSVALQVAMQEPEAVGKIALYDAWVYHDQIPTFFTWAQAPGVGEALMAMFYRERTDEKMASAFYDPDRYVTDALIEHVESSLVRPGAMAGALEAIRGQNFEDDDRYGEIKQPVLLMWGREDKITLLSYGERLASQLPGATMKVYPRCGHFPMVEAASASTRDLLVFLAPEEAP